MKLYVVTLLSVFAGSFLFGFSFLDEANGLGMWIPIAISACFLAAMISLGGEIVNAHLEEENPEFWTTFMRRHHKRRFRDHHHRLPPAGKAA